MRRALIGILAASVILPVGGLAQNLVAWGQYSGAAGAVGVTTTVVVQSSKTAIGQDIQYPTSSPEVAALIVNIAPGGQTGRHKHPVPVFGYVLDGTLTVATEGHGVAVYTQGQGFMESMNTWHNGMNRGARPVKVLAVFMGGQGKPNVIRP